MQAIFYRNFHIKIFICMYISIIETFSKIKQVFEIFRGFSVVF